MPPLGENGKVPPVNILSRSQSFFDLVFDHLKLAIFSDRDLITFFNFDGQRILRHLREDRLNRGASLREEAVLENGFNP